MCSFHKKYGCGFGITCYLAFLFFCEISNAQVNSDSIKRAYSGSFFHLRDSASIPIYPASLRSPNISLRNKNNLFFDSLKEKASKNVLTKKLFEFVIVSPKPVDKQRITALSEAGFITYSGLVIRSIRIQKVNVFGGNINNPAASDPSNIEDIINKTHFNTTEKIIRKNLLFKVNDTVSPLVLSDNERILRHLPYINDARIVVIPVSDFAADIVVLTKDVYSIGGELDYHGFKKGTISVFDKNIFGIGHELGFNIPYDAEKINSPGFGFDYIVDNIAKSFINLNVSYSGGLGERKYGISLSRKLVSSTTKYAGGISINQMYTTEDLDTLIVPEPLKYNLQDYWISRSFLLNRESVSRLIIGARYTNNNIFDKPVILPDSYYKLQKYRLYLASAAFSVQKFYKTNMIYGYGRTEDIPYGGLFKITIGHEQNEFKNRTYIGSEISYGKSSRDLGYFYTSAGIGTYFNGSQTEQGILTFSMRYFSNLVYAANHTIRNFLYIDYSRGFDRYTDEFLYFKKENGFSAFANDSISGRQRLTVSLESVLFSEKNVYGFRFAFFGFTDFSFLSGSNQNIVASNTLACIGCGIRIRNDNMVFNTIQLRLAFFPNPPVFSRINSLSISGEQLLRPNNFESGPPSTILYR